MVYVRVQIFTQSDLLFPNLYLVNNVIPWENLKDLYNSIPVRHEAYFTSLFPPEMTHK